MAVVLDGHLVAAFHLYVRPFVSTQDLDCQQTGRFERQGRILYERKRNDAVASFAFLSQ